MAWPRGVMAEAPESKTKSPTTFVATRPPRRSFFSRTTGVWPLARKALAAARPEMPAPTIPTLTLAAPALASFYRFSELPIGIAKSLCTLKGMGRQRFKESDPVVEILNIALENQGGADLSLRQRLLASASELGIPEEAALEAEKQWLSRREENVEKEAYRAEVMRDFYTHLGVFAVINIFLVILNMLTEHGRVDWAFYVIVSWGLAVGVHAVAAYYQLSSPQEFEEWKQKRNEKRSGGLTIGIHIWSSNRDDA